jgi:hypothetical protein
MNDSCEIIDQFSCQTNRVVANPAFYNHESLGIVRDQIQRFIWNLPRANCTRFYLSSQMHCLAGALEEGQQFLSTWNDLPLTKPEENPVIANHGIPLLHSMPINKLILESEKVYFSSTCLKTSSSRNSAEIAYFSSPLSLLMSPMSGAKIPCSLSWWQSSCISTELLSRSLNGTTYISELPLHLQDDELDPALGLLGEIFFYPEAGDLQASTASAIQGHDVVINLGTGSQIVFRHPVESSPIPFYRFWPNISDPLPTISHLPCGRLLAAYAEARGMEINQLLACFNQLRPDFAVEKASRFPSSLLFFPGYCFQAHRYLQCPPVSLEQLAELEPEALLSLWLFQYASIICDFFRESNNVPRQLSIGVTGSLGGMAKRFVELLNDLLPVQYAVAQNGSEVCHSVLHSYRP